MAETRRPSQVLGRASVRVRTTAAATLVVAVALLLGALTLVSMVRDSMRDAAESTAEQRATALADQIETSGLPINGSGDEGPRWDRPGGPPGPPDDDSDEADDNDGEPDDSDEEPDSLVWQVFDETGALVRSSQPLLPPLPTEDRDSVRLPEGDHEYVVVTEEASSGALDHLVVVAASLEPVEESIAALVPPLVVGLPAVLLLVGGVTWVVTGRALAPVERIRREVEQITGDRLERRVPEPASRDEIGRLARTMNQMLARLQSSRDRQRQFVADASHELRSPLAGIRQTAEVAHAHPGALPEGELAEAVLEESVRMQHLIEQLLLLTRADEGAGTRGRSEVDLDDVVLEGVRRMRRPGLRVDTTRVTAARVLGDPIGLGQVVRNLLDNAARHAASVVEVEVASRGSDVELAVCDDGAGVPPEQRERIFERFVRLDEARARDDGGSGLGLAIVRSIVEAHGGHVHVESSSLGGARFVVRLPGAPG